MSVYTSATGKLKPKLINVAKVIASKMVSKTNLSFVILARLLGYNCWDTDVS